LRQFPSGRRLVWAQRIILALILLFPASHLHAAIDRYTDDKGIIHITNNNAAQPDIEEAAPDFSPPRPPETSPPAPPSPEAEPPDPGGEPEKSAGPNSYLHVRQGVIHITNVASSQVKPVQATPGASPAPAAFLPVSSRAVAAPVASVKPAAGLTAAPAPAGTSLASGASVNRYEDSKGVIHITNVPPRAIEGDIMVAGWSSLPAANKGGAGEAPGAGSFLARRAATWDPPLQPALFTEPGPPDVLPVKAASAAPTPVDGRSGAKVRRFKDAEGVLHIVGRGPPLRGPPLPPAAAERRRAHLRPLPPGTGEFSRASPRRGPSDRVLARKDRQGRLVIQNTPPLPSHMGGGKEERRRQLAPVLAEAAQRFSLPISLIEAVIQVESNFQAAAVSPKGAMGLMQLMPGTADFLGVADPFCPRQNVLGGTRYLRLLLDLFGQSLPLALAAYNAGFQRVLNAGHQIPNIKETQDFVAKVTANYQLREKVHYARRHSNL
jgi:hypothetical protein